MIIQVITLFPEMFTPFFATGMMWKASKNKKVDFKTVELRQFGIGKRLTVDDTPYGGGDGMVLKPEPLLAAIEQAKNIDPSALVILPTPRGQMYKQSSAKKLAATAKGLIIICPRYEGYDERITKWVDKQYCIGNFVLTGGEIPAMAIIDSVVRLIPGVLGGKDSAILDSFQDDDKTVEWPQYTRPEMFKGMKVPEVLLNGNHAAINRWRHSGSQ